MTEDTTVQNRTFTLRSWLIVTIVAVPACGGKSDFFEPNPEYAAGTSGQGGSNAGGSNAGGRGGTPSDARCTQPAPSFRSCDGTPFFYHEVASGECIGVEDFRCADDEASVFDTLAECLATCRGARPAPEACDAASDCIVAQPGCCGGCDPIEQRQLRAVHRTRRDVLGNDCDVACGACPEVAELERTRQYFVPACDNGACYVEDLRDTSATECEVDGDCTLRDGSECCEGCDGLGLVAVSNTRPIREACEEEVACDACAPPESDEYEAACNDEGRCVVRLNPNNPNGRLTSGDPERCPPRSQASDDVCDEPLDAECVYASAQFGISVQQGPIECFCSEDARWVCLATGTQWNPRCPRTYPPTNPCEPAMECEYAIGSATASCWCERAEYVCVLNE